MPHTALISLGEVGLALEIRVEFREPFSDNLFVARWVGYLMTLHSAQSKISPIPCRSNCKALFTCLNSLTFAAHSLLRFGSLGSAFGQPPNIITIWIGAMYRIESLALARTLAARSR